MKNIRNFIRLMLVPVCLIATYACSDYLDVVPEKKAELELFFERRNTALGALAACYSFLPQSDVVYHTFSLASEELVTPPEQNVTPIPGMAIVWGRQSSTAPILGYWDDFTGKHVNYVVEQNSLWKGIRYCNTFIELIDNVGDMEYLEKQQWKAEAMFLKAYYHFLLFSQYGPIPIVDDNLSINATPEEIRIERKPVDEVVDYIVKTIDKARASLPNRYTDNSAGRVDRVVAAAIKSRVLLYAASPLFNGNAQFYDRFKGKNDELLFNITEDKNKWKLAADAAKEALDMALAYSRIYVHDSIMNPVNLGDSLLYGAKDISLINGQEVTLQPIKAVYDYRYMFTDPWNVELLWGRAYYTSWYRLQAAAFPMSTTIGVSQGAAWSWLVPTLDIVEAYYTKNGLPMEEDKTFNYENRYRMARVPSDGRDTLFIERKGANIPRLHQDREPRFYASIGFDEAYFWIWGTKWTLHSYKGAANGRAGTKDYSPTGYILAKVQHLKGQSDNYDNLLYYPFPIIRLGELYLNYAEALNEYLDQPNQEVWDALNVIRRRAAIPDVELAWGDANLAKTPDKHKTRDGMREIIHAERRIELAFEGNRLFDIKRWKEGEKWLTNEIRGWNIEGTNANDYYALDGGLPPAQIYNRSFITPRDYLFPISYNELLLNSNLVQNPGW